MTNETVKREEIERFICDYLSNNPDFFLTHPDILELMTLPQKQEESEGADLDLFSEADYQGEKTEAAAETKNEATACVMLKEHKKMLDFACKLVHFKDDASLPNTVLDHFKDIFETDLGTIRLWNLMPNFAFLDFGERIDPEAEASICAMPAPYYGMNEGSMVADWLRVQESQTRSVLLVPLKRPQGDVFGFICLASPDTDHFDRYSDGDVIQKTTELAQTSLSRLTH